MSRLNELLIIIWGMSLPYVFEWVTQPYWTAADGSPLCSVTDYGPVVSANGELLK